MFAAKANILAQLQRDILSLQGLRKMKGSEGIDIGLDVIKFAFPDECFPLSAVHEFISKAASCGFIACLISSLMKNGGAVIWIGQAQTIFPNALNYYGIPPEKVVFI